MYICEYSIHNCFILLRNDIIKEHLPIRQDNCDWGVTMYDILKLYIPDLLPTVLSYFCWVTIHINT